MTNGTHSQDPVEGAPEVVDRELERKPVQKSGKDAAPGSGDARKADDLKRADQRSYTPEAEAPGGDLGSKAAMPEGIKPAEKADE